MVPEKPARGKGQAGTRPPAASRTEPVALARPRRIALSWRIMLDYRFIKDNLDAVKKNIADRYMKADADLVVRALRRAQRAHPGARGRAQEAQRQRRGHEGQARAPSRGSRSSTRARPSRRASPPSRPSSSEVEAGLDEEGRKIPNMAHPDAPVGKEDKDNLEVKRVGRAHEVRLRAQGPRPARRRTSTSSTSTPPPGLGHQVLLPQERGASSSSSALVRYALDILMKKGFTLFITPDVAKTEILEGIGFNPRGAESNIYTVEGEGTCLIGTAEITLGGYYSGTRPRQGQAAPQARRPLPLLPPRGGRRGPVLQGPLPRPPVHQGRDVRLLPARGLRPHPRGAPRASRRRSSRASASPSASSTPAPATSAPPPTASGTSRPGCPAATAASGARSPRTSNCTDFQARRLNVKYKDDDGKNKYVHMLNGTAIACSRGHHRRPRELPAGRRLDQDARRPSCRTPASPRSAAPNSSFAHVHRTAPLAGRLF